MALTLDATPKGASSNSYCTKAEADTYHEARLHASDWSGADDATKEAALVWATRVLEDYVDWFGTPTTVTQALRWPRQGLFDRDSNTVDEDTIPQFLINATSELARLLIAEDRTDDPDTSGFERISVGPISLSVNTLDRIKVIPENVWAMISYYGDRIHGGGSAFRTSRLVRV